MRKEARKSALDSQAKPHHATQFTTAQPNTEMYSERPRAGTSGDKTQDETTRGSRRLQTELKVF